jgi:hypothetical protein
MSQMELGTPSDEFAYIADGKKVHITFSPQTLLLRCGRTGTHLIGKKYEGAETDICHKCLDSYNLFAVFVSDLKSNPAVGYLKEGKD